MCESLCWALYSATLILPQNPSNSPIPTTVWMSQSRIAELLSLLIANSPAKDVMAFLMFVRAAYPSLTRRNITIPFCWTVWLSVLMANIPIWSTNVRRVSPLVHSAKMLRTAPRAFQAHGSITSNVCSFAQISSTMTPQASVCPASLLVIFATA